MRRRPSFAVCVVATAFALYAAYALQAGWAAGSARFVLVGLCALLAAVGLLLGQPWSRFLVCGLAALFVHTWLSMVWQVARVGWPYSTATDTVLSLVPGLVLLVACAGSVLIAFRHFRR
jgi:hypothetical protein